jgi:hypothetical protein
MRHSFEGCEAAFRFSCFAELWWHLGGYLETAISVTMTLLAEVKSLNGSVD